MKRLTALGMLAGAAAIAAAPGAAGHVPTVLKPVTKKVTVADDYYGPTTLTVKRGSTIKWVWSYANGNSHDVKLQKGPAGVKRFHSEPAASQFTFAKKLTVPGTYRIVCTLHQTMKMTITVKR